MIASLYIIATPYNNCEKVLLVTVTYASVTLSHFNYVFTDCSISFMLNLFFPNVPFGPPSKHQKTKGFLIFSGASKRNIGKKRIQVNGSVYSKPYILTFLTVQSLSLWKAWSREWLLLAAAKSYFWWYELRKSQHLNVLSSKNRYFKAWFGTCNKNLLDIIPCRCPDQAIYDESFTLSKKMIQTQTNVYPVRLSRNLENLVLKGETANKKEIIPRISSNN